MHERAIKKLLGREAENGVNNLQCTIEISNEKRKKKLCALARNLRQKKRKSSARLLQFLRFTQLPSKLDPGLPFTTETLDIHLTTLFLLLLFYCVSSLSVVKIANLAGFFYPKDEFSYLKLL